MRHLHGHRPSDTSRRVFNELDRESRQGLILNALRLAGHPMTDREIMAAIYCRDPNKVRPRITEMIDLGLLKVAGRKVDPMGETNVPVRMTVLADAVGGPSLAATVTDAQAELFVRDDTAMRQERRRLMDMRK